MTRVILRKMHAHTREISLLSIRITNRNAKEKEPHKAVLTINSNCGGQGRN